MLLVSFYKQQTTKTCGVRRYFEDIHDLVEFQIKFIVKPGQNQCHQNMQRDLYSGPTNRPTFSSDRNIFDNNSTVPKPYERSPVQGKFELFTHYIIRYLGTYFKLKTKTFRHCARYTYLLIF